MAKIKIGDLFEINTPKGKAYLHYIYKDTLIADLIRVLPGLYSKRPHNLSLLAKAKENYMIYFPLSAAYNKKIVEHVGHFDFGEFAKPDFMRSKHIVRGEFLGWHIINTNTMYRQLFTNLSSEQKTLSPWGIWNDTLLIDRLVEGWTLEQWE